MAPLLWLSQSGGRGLDGREIRGNRWIEKGLRKVFGGGGVLSDLHNPFKPEFPFLLLTEQRHVSEINTKGQTVNKKNHGKCQGNGASDLALSFLALYNTVQHMHCNQGQD